MRIKFVKYGKRMIGSDGQSEYFEASAEVGLQDYPEDAAAKVRQFVKSQLSEPEPQPGSIGDHLASKGQKL